MGALHALDRSDFTIPELLKEIQAKTKCSYDDLAKMLGISHTQIGRVVRGEQPYLAEESLVSLVRQLDLPFRRVAYANAMARFSQDDLRNVPETDLLVDDGSTVERGDISAFGYLRLPYREWNEAKTVVQRMALIRQHGVMDAVRMNNVKVIPTEGFVYLRHAGVHMQSGVSMHHIIPDRALVEVEILTPETEANLRDGDVVFVQLHDDYVTAYQYFLKKWPHGIYETYQPINQRNPVRLVKEVKDMTKPLMFSRILVGRATRIVDYQLTS